MSKLHPLPSSGRDDARAASEALISEALISEAFAEAGAPVVDSARTQQAGECSVGKEWRVLVVDDQPDMVDMMQLMLSRRGYCVATASAAHRAIEIALDFQPDLIISDIGMPGMDGCAMMRALRIEKKLPPFKAIALTGFGLPTDQEHARDAGFDFCLVKPLDFATFFDCVEDRLEQQSRETADDMAAASCLHTTSELRPSFDSGPDSGLESTRLPANARSYST